MLAYAAFYAQAYVIFNAVVFKAHGAHGAVFNAKAAFYAFFAVNLYFGGYASLLPMMKNRLCIAPCGHIKRQ